MSKGLVARKSISGTKVGINKYQITVEIQFEIKVKCRDKNGNFWRRGRSLIKIEGASWQRPAATSLPPVADHQHQTCISQITPPGFLDKA